MMLHFELLNPRVLLGLTLPFFISCMGSRVHKSNNSNYKMYSFMFPLLWGKSSLLEKLHYFESSLG